MIKYHQGGDLVDYVWYRGKDKDGTILFDLKHTACFANLFNGSVPTNCVVIEFYHERIRVPYEDKSIERWVNMLTEVGFPCSVEIQKEEVVFSVFCENYKHKPHILSTLMLLRLMTESALTALPEQFFQAEDEDPKIDKFKLLEDIHINRNSQGLGYMNSGHMVTYNTKPQKRVSSFKKLMDNFEASDMPLHYKGRGSRGYYSTVNDAWWGNYVKNNTKDKAQEDEVVALKPKRKKLAEEVF